MQKIAAADTDKIMLKSFLDVNKRHGIITTKSPTLINMVQLFITLTFTRFFLCALPEKKKTPS